MNTTNPDEVLTARLLRIFAKCGQLSAEAATKEYNRVYPVVIGIKKSYIETHLKLLVDRGHISKIPSTELYAITPLGTQSLNKTKQK
jgi:hypothetical protein